MTQIKTTGRTLLVKTAFTNRYVAYCHRAEVLSRTLMALPRMLKTIDLGTIPTGGANQMFQERNEE